jgi:hypothetical protein
LGDSLQSDLPKNKSGAFSEKFQWFSKPENKDFFESEGVYTFKLTEEDIVRSRLVKFFIEEFKKMDAAAV